MGVVQRLAGAGNRRPFGRPESWFYESAGAVAVADALGPRFDARLGDGRVLDVGCGGGVLAGRLARPGRSVVGIDPSAPQVARARAAGTVAVRSGVERLPFTDAAFQGLYSSCSIKHWRDRAVGVAECLRVVRPGGWLVIAEMDGASTNRRLRAFASTTRIPRALHPAYPYFARASMVVVCPTAEELAAALDGAGAVEVGQEQLEDLPFALAWGRRP